MSSSTINGMLVGKMPEDNENAALDHRIEDLQFWLVTLTWSKPKTTTLGTSIAS